MGSRNMYGAATMVTPKAVASAMSYGHQWANAIEGKMATWAEARSAKRYDIFPFLSCVKCADQCLCTLAGSFAIALVVAPSRSFM